MKRKFICISTAIYIFLYSTIYCFCVPVSATVPTVEFTLFDGFSTLFWSLGLGVVGVETTQEKETFEDVMDRSFSEALLGYDSETQSQYTEFCNNVQNGYMLIGSKLWDFFTDYCFNEVTNSNFFKNVPSEFYQFVNTYSGYYFLSNNSYIDRNTTNNKELCCALVSDNFEYINPPVKISSASNYNEYKWGQRTINQSISWAHIYLKDNNTTTSGVLNSSEIYCYFRVHPYVNNMTYSYLGYHAISDTNNANLTSLTDVSDVNDYDLILDGVWLDNGENITTSDGVIPQVLNSDVVQGVVTDITSGQLTWEDSLTDVIENDYPENPAIPDNALTLPELDNLIQNLHLERLESKFPFCIPHDIQLIYNGATVVSGNAPILTIPIHLQVRDTVYYDDEDFLIIDFSMFDDIIPIFREGFFLLFLVGLLWVSIEILQAFFVVTE